MKVEEIPQEKSTHSWSKMKNRKGEGDLFFVQELRVHNSGLKSIAGINNDINDEDEIISSSTPSPTKLSESAQNGDFYSSLRLLFLLGRILGIIPITGLSHQNHHFKHVYFRWYTFAVLCSVPIILLQTVSAVLSFWDLFKMFAGSGGGNASQLAIAARNPFFYTMSVFVYAFFLLRAKKLIELFTEWRKVSLDLGFKAQDTSLRKHCILAIVILFGSGMVENLIYTVKSFPVIPRDEVEWKKEMNFSSLETYYWRSQPFWANLVPFNPVLTIILLVANTLANYSWNYADIFLVISSRALYFKFKILVEQTDQRLLSKHNNQIIFQFRESAQSWAQVRKDHLTLCKLLDQFEVFLSPLVFVSYSMNIFFLCLELHEGLTPQEHQTFMDSTFSAWSFVHVVFRVLSVSLTAAKVNEYAHAITNCIQRCSTDHYCKELERLERMLGTGAIGLSGLGCFVITRAFLLMVVSVIFTVEIVLLQASASNNKPP